MVRSWELSEFVSDCVDSSMDWLGRKRRGLLGEDVEVGGMFEGVSGRAGAEGSIRIRGDCVLGGWFVRRNGEGCRCRL